MNIIEKIVVKYLISTTSGERVFFASLLTLIRKEECNTVDTAAVTITDGQLYLLYNKTFIEDILEKYGSEKVKGVLEHELLHIVYDHLGRGKRLNRDHDLHNIAADISINQLIDKNMLPAFLPTKIEDKTIWKNTTLSHEQYNLPAGKDTEYYYNALLKQDKNKKKCTGCGKTLDDHSVWDKIKENEQMTKEVIKGAVREAYNNAKKIKGDMPGYLEKAITGLLRPPTINWKQQLKQYVGVSIKTGFKSSWKRPPRRRIQPEGGIL